MIISHNPKFLCLNPPKTGTGYIEFVFEYSGYMTKKDYKLIKNRHSTASDTKKTFVNSGTNTTGRINFLTGKGKRKKYLGVVVK